MVATAAAYDSGPIAFRYPRGEAVEVELPEHGVPLPIGKGRILCEGNCVAILTLGTRLAGALQAAEELEERGVSTTVADARFAKPLDEELIVRLARSHRVLITVEEGFNRRLKSFRAKFAVQTRPARTGDVKFRSLVLPDVYLEADTPERMYAQAGLDTDGMVRKVLKLLDLPPANASLHLMDNNKPL